MAKGIQLDGFPRTSIQAKYLSLKGKKDGTPKDSKNLVFIGPPAAGKGTQARKIEQKWGLPHISSGSTLRELKDHEFPPDGETPGDYIDEGRTIPDYMMLQIADQMLYDKLGEDQGLSRMEINPDTVKELREMDPDEVEPEEDFVDLVIYLKVDRKNIVERVTGRRECRECNANYHMKFEPPETEGKCDDCGGEVIQREDDTEEKVKTRIEIFKEETKPLVGYYDRKGLLVTVDGNPEIGEVKERIFSIMEERFPDLER